MSEVTTYSPDKGDLARLEANLNKLPEIFEIVLSEYTDFLVVGWKDMVEAVDAIDTARFVGSIAAHESTDGLDGEATKMFVIDTESDSDVVYSDIVERGKKDGNYAKGKPLADDFGGRYPAGRSLEHQHEEDLLEHVATQVLDNFLHA